MVAANLKHRRIIFAVHDAGIACNVIGIIIVGSKLGVEATIVADVVVLILI